MSTFEGNVLSQTVAIARDHRIDPAALLAVVETESAGKSMDGKYPCLLFERHVFYRELKKLNPDRLQIAVNAGLANASWQPKTQYKDQGTSAKRVALYERAKAIDQECAVRSCSWGVGQTCGFLAEELRFKNGITMLAYMMQGGVPAQVECMVREIENKKLTVKLNRHDWAGFAKSYNGPGYAQNHYDTKMASAYLRWSKDIQGMVVTVAKPVVVSNDVNPKPPVQPTTNTTKIGQASAGAAAGAGGLWAAFKNFHWEYVLFGVFVLVLIGIGVYIVHRRNSQKVQTGVLTDAMEDVA